MVALNSKVFRIEFDGLVNRLGEVKKKPIVLHFDPVDFERTSSQVSDLLQA